MRLRIPCGQMQHKVSTFGFWFVEIGITLCERTEEFAPRSFEMKTKRRVECVACFVAQNSHALGVAAPFDFQHLLAFEFHEAWMREIKRNRDSRHAVRRKPF